VKQVVDRFEKSASLIVIIFISASASSAAIFYLSLPASINHQLSV
jgi:hypothetical protein